MRAGGGVKLTVTFWQGDDQSGSLGPDNPWKICSYCLKKMLSSPTMTVSRCMRACVRAFMHVCVCSFDTQCCTGHRVSQFTVNNTEGKEERKENSSLSHKKRFNIKKKNRYRRPAGRLSHGRNAAPSLGTCAGCASQHALLCLALPSLRARWLSCLI